jgi:TusA-related sulfurtransferase
MPGDLTMGPGTAPASTAVIDLAGAEQECGEPALERVRRGYAVLPPGEFIEVRTPIAEHAFAVRAWARRSGAELVDDLREGAETVVRVRRPA